VLARTGLKVGDMRLSSAMTGSGRHQHYGYGDYGYSSRMLAVDEQVKERKERRDAEVRRDERVQGRRLFVGGVPRGGYSTAALLAALGLEKEEVRFDKDDEEVMLRGQGPVCYVFVEVNDEAMAGKLIEEAKEEVLMMKDRVLRVNMAGVRGYDDGQGKQSGRKQGAGQAMPRGRAVFVPAPPPSGRAWSSQSGSSQAVGGSGRQQPARGGEAVQGVGGQGEGSQRQMQLMMQGAVRAVMREASAQVVSEVTSKVVEAVKGAMVVEVGKVVAASMGEIVQQGIRDAVVGQVNASMGAMVTEQHAMVLEVREAVGAVGRVQQQVEEVGVVMRSMQEVLQQQALDLTGFAKETLQRLGAVGDGVEGMRQEERATSGGLMASASGIMDGQKAAIAQLHALERQCREMSEVLGVRGAAGDDVSVGSSGSHSSVVMVREVGQVQSAKQGREQRQGDGVNQVMEEGPAVSNVPGAVSGAGEEQEEAGTAKKQKGVGVAPPALPS
jgi:hypothetical protein